MLYQTLIPNSYCGFTTVQTVCGVSVTIMPRRVKKCTYSGGPKTAPEKHGGSCNICVTFSEGGFTEFKAKYPSLCTSSEMMRCVTDHHHNHPHHSSLSQPCLPVSNVGPTRILPFLLLGSQMDAMSRETMLVGWKSALTVRIGL